LVRDDAGGLHIGACIFAGDAVDRLLWRYREHAFLHLDNAAVCSVGPTYRIGEDTAWFGPIALEGADQDS
jgi:hypothetical protein